MPSRGSVWAQLPVPPQQRFLYATDRPYEDTDAARDTSGRKPAEAAYVVLSGIDICGVETAEDPWQVTDPWRHPGPTATGKGADRQRRFDPMSMPVATGRRSCPERFELSPPQSELPPTPPPRTPSARKPPQLLEHAPPPLPRAPGRWPYESPFECKLCRAEGVYGQSCRFHRSNGPCTQHTDPVKKYPSTELDPEENGSTVQTDPELCKLESGDAEKENFEPPQHSPLSSSPSQVSDGCPGNSRTAEGRRDMLRLIPTSPRCCRRGPRRCRRGSRSFGWRSVFPGEQGAWHRPSGRGGPLPSAQRNQPSWYTTCSLCSGRSPHKPNTECGPSQRCFIADHNSREH